MIDYEERLALPLWWWPAGLGLASLAAAVVHSGAGGLRAVVPYVVLLPMAVVVLLRLSRGRIRVADGVLHVPGARIPVTHLAAGTPYDAQGSSTSLPRLADPMAFLALRSWVPTGVRLEVDDPADDTPYWLVSSRRPEQLLAAVRSSSAGRAPSS